MNGLDEQQAHNSALIFCSGRTKVHN